MENDMTDPQKSLIAAWVACLALVVTAGAQIRPVSIGSESNLFVWTRHVQRLRAAGRRRGLAHRSWRRQRARPSGRDRRSARRVGAVHASPPRAVPGDGQAGGVEAAGCRPGDRAGLVRRPDPVSQGQAHAGRCLHGTRGQLRPAAPRADPAGSHVQGPGRVHLARPRVPLPRHERQQSRRPCPTC